MIIGLSLVFNHFFQIMYNLAIVDENYYDAIIEHEND